MMERGVEEEMRSEAAGSLPPGPEPVELFPVLKTGRGGAASTPALGVALPDPAGERALILLGG